MTILFEVRKMIGVYAIRNTETNKIYYGSSKNIEKRFDEHRLSLMRGDHYNKSLQKDWNKLGQICFQFLEVEECSADMLIEREQHWISSQEGKLYNRRSAGRKGKFLSDESKKQISEKLVGHVHSEETKKKISDSLKGRKMYEMTDETREKLRQKAKEQWRRKREQMS